MRTGVLKCQWAASDLCQDCQEAIEVTFSPCFILLPSSQALLCSILLSLSFPWLRLCTLSWCKLKHCAVCVCKECYTRTSHCLCGTAYRFNLHIAQVGKVYPLRHLLPLQIDYLLSPRQWPQDYWQGSVKCLSLSLISKLEMDLSLGREQTEDVNCTCWQHYLNLSQLSCSLLVTLSDVSA